MQNRSATAWLLFEAPNSHDDVITNYTVRTYDLSDPIVRNGTNYTDTVYPAPAEPQARRCCSGLSPCYRGLMCLNLLSPQLQVEFPDYSHIYGVKVSR